MALDAANRLLVGNHFMRMVTTTLGVLTKAELRAAIDATDQWIDDNQTSYNNALPLPARTELTLAQKTLLFCFVAMRRAGLLVVEED